MLSKPRRGGAVPGLSLAWGQVRPGRRVTGSHQRLRSHFWGACFGALHKPGCQPRAHRRESVGPAAAGEGEVGEEGAMHPEARAGGGRDTGSTRDASGGGPLPSPTGERGRASGRSSPAPTTTLRATAAAKAQVTPRQGLSAGAALQPAAPARRAHGTGSLCPLRGRPPHASQHLVLSARGQTAAGQGRGPGSPPCGGRRPAARALKRRVRERRFGAHPASEPGAGARRGPRPVAPGPREPRDGVGRSAAPRGVRWPFCLLPRPGR